MQVGRQSKCSLVPRCSGHIKNSLNLAHAVLLAHFMHLGQNVCTNDKALLDKPVFVFIKWLYIKIYISVWKYCPIWVQVLSQICILKKTDRLQEKWSWRWKRSLPHSLIYMINPTKNTRTSISCATNVETKGIIVWYQRES